MTGNDVITAALRKLGVLSVGEPLDADQAASGLDALNDLLEAWSIDRTSVYNTVAAQYALTTGKQSYTIGKDPAGLLTADFDVARPDRVSDAKLIIAGQRYDLDIVEDHEWADRPLQTLSGIPSMLYVDGGFPFHTLSLDPAPANGYTLELWSWQALTAFANGATKYYFPHSYGRALKANLAIELAPDYDREPSPTLQKNAADSLAAIRNLNLTTPVMDVDPAVLGGRRGRTQQGWLGNYR